jgi:hypothetical protein
MAIRVRIELVRHGVEQPVEIARADLWNDLSGTRTRGNYRYRLYSKGRLWREGKAGGFERLQKNVWWLLMLICRNAMPDKIGDFEEE